MGLGRHFIAYMFRRLVNWPPKALMTTSSGVILQTGLPLPLIARGKVRDIYQVGADLLIVATDRISAFDYILPTGIPRKGEVLNRISLFWFDFLKDLAANHIITADVKKYPAMLWPHRAQLEGRSMLVQRADMIQVECVARGYLSGSGWKEYRDTGAVCGIPLPAGLRESDKLPEPVFTPATKAETGHDENISFDRVVDKIGGDTAERLRDLTLRIYRTAADYADTRGIIIADTKFEFGFVQGKLVLADEVLTPDSSRFWPKSEYAPGGPQPSYDKQFVRDYLESIGWNKQPPAPVLPDDVVERTSAKYREAYRLLAGVEI
jgi:phosphoribosylaminoimidazole-succinocarboxamide synthase